MGAVDESRPAVRLLCSKKSLFSPPSTGVRWLVGSPLFLPPLTVPATLRCLHSMPADPFSPDLPKEAEDIKTLLIKGFDIVGALFVGSTNCEEDASKALEVSWKLKKHLFGDRGSHNMIGASANTLGRDIHFLVCKSDGTKVAEGSSFIYEDYPESYLWEKGCLLRCELPLKLPVYVPLNERADVEACFSSLIKSTAAKLRDAHVAYLVEGPPNSPDESPRSIILHGNELNFGSEIPVSLPHRSGAQESNSSMLACSHFCSTNRYNLSSTARESADAIRITVLSNQSVSNLKSGAPVVEYFPAPAPAILSVISLKLDVLCYTSINFPVAAAVSELVVPGLIDQLNFMKKATVRELPTQQLQLCPFHFLPPGFLIPLTTIYDIRYGEIEEKQGQLRKSLHLRLGLPLDRPLLRISNALTFNSKGKRERSLTRDGSSLLRDVHTEIPSSGVSGGITSWIDGSYEYYHYLHDGIDDNGWGCAYRSLQTIISWYRLQQYTSIDVPSHRDIQQALVEIGDKDPSFVGSREWIGAIELSFVLDKLLGVSCKIINVMSGDELPEKCRELAMHFETQGTPVMIGGGVLAYTLLGVDYNEASGDCAFLILDPHYTGADDLKKIVNGGWCGWKKAVDSKGRSFFLKDKFYNLLLPQRPNVV